MAEKCTIWKNEFSFGLTIDRETIYTNYTHHSPTHKCNKIMFNIQILFTEGKNNL